MVSALSNDIYLSSFERVYPGSIVAALHIICHFSVRFLCYPTGHGAQNSVLHTQREICIHMYICICFSFMLKGRKFPIFICLFMSLPIYIIFLLLHFIWLVILVVYYVA